MTDQSSPITPPPELVEQWYDAIDNQSTSWKQQLATRAAQWGADQELEACHCEVFFWVGKSIADRLQATRRPKPPSLKEQALTKLTQIVVDLDRDGMRQQASILEGPIRRALEALPND